MYRRIFAVFAALLLLFAGGCASIPGSGRSSNGAPASLDVNEATIYGGGGAGLGYAIGSMVGLPPAATAIVFGAVGYFLGREEDRKAHAVGLTNCRWEHFGEVDANGVTKRTGSIWKCDGGNQVSGNRGTPPAVRRQ